MHPDEQTGTCAASLTRTLAHLAERGVTVMTDNALNYVRGHAFRRAASAMQHLTTRPTTADQWQSIEQFNRTLLEEWAYLRTRSTNADRLATLTEFVDDYNYVRTHSSIGNRPPAPHVKNVTGSNS